MKKTFTTFLMLLLTMCLFAQTQQRILYQVEVRDSKGTLLTNHDVHVRTSVFTDSVTGPAIFVETHNAKTNEKGVATIEIGRGYFVEGSFSQIDWASGPYFIKSEIDPKGGDHYTITNTQELLNTPTVLSAAAEEARDAAEQARIAAEQAQAAATKASEQQTTTNQPQKTIYIGMPWSTFFTVNAACSGIPDWTYGFKIGGMGMLGWYFSAMTNFNFNGAFESFDREVYELTGAQRVAKMSAILGFVVRPCKPLSIHVGAGYSYRALTLETNKGWLSYPKRSYHGVDANFGLMFHIFQAVISAEVVYNTYDFNHSDIDPLGRLEGRVGVGFCLPNKRVVVITD